MRRGEAAVCLTNDDQGICNHSTQRRENQLVMTWTHHPAFYHHSVYPPVDPYSIYRTVRGHEVEMVAKTRDQDIPWRLNGFHISHHWPTYPILRQRMTHFLRSGPASCCK